MAVLPYCIFSSGVEVESRETGVRGTRVRRASMSDLNAIYSEHEDLGGVTNDDALAFHGVVEGVFSQVAVVPFRFPTLLASRSDLEDHLRENHEVYAADLNRFRSLVQMELLIFQSESRKPGQAPPNGASGTEYLRWRSQSLERLASAAGRIRKLLGNYIADWRQSSPSTHPQKGEAVRCYALIERAGMGRFTLQVRESGSSGISVSLSGPWPPTAFMRSVTQEPV